MLKRFIGRIRDLFARLFRRKPPAAGYFAKGDKLSMWGWVRVAPWVRPSREYLLYVPRGYGGWKRHPLLVMIHGCKQTPEEFASAIRIAALADENGWLVLLPRQTEKANKWSCWNWFDKATSAGRGEAAIVAAQVKAVCRSHRVDRARVFVAGFSSGGALTAAVALHYPNLFAGAFVHSALACGAASSPAAALKVMREGANTDSARIGAAARAAAGGDVRLPIVIVQGEQDDVVAAANARDVVRQFLALNGYALARAAAKELPEPDHENRVALAGARAVTTSDYRAGERMAVRLVLVKGLQHAWSGGDPAFPYNDARPPDATALLADAMKAAVDGASLRGT